MYDTIPPSFMKCFLSALCFLFGSILSAQVGGGPDGIMVAPPPTKLPVITFMPKNLGRATLRSAKATRGDATQVSIYTLTAENSNLTLSSSPTVFWFQNQEGKIQITVNDMDRKRTLFSKVTSSPMNQGINQLNFSDIGVRIDPGINYEWSVMYMISEDTPSLNPVARGAVLRVVPEEGLMDQLMGIKPGIQRAQILAANGIFYDALSDLSLVLGSYRNRSDVANTFHQFVKSSGAGP